jgi:hypothetical protein
LKNNLVRHIYQCQQEKQSELRWDAESGGAFLVKMPRRLRGLKKNISLNRNLSLNKKIILRDSADLDATPGARPCHESWHDAPLGRFCDESTGTAFLVFIFLQIVKYFFIVFLKRGFGIHRSWLAGPSVWPIGRMIDFTSSAPEVRFQAHEESIF